MSFSIKYTVLRNLSTCVCLVVLLSGCATTSSMRSEPLTSGISRSFEAEYDVVLKATRGAFVEAGIKIEEGRALDTDTYMLLGETGMSTASYGEKVRAVVARARVGATVTVLTKKKLATNVFAKGDYSGSIFSSIEVQLDFARRESGVAGHGTQTDEESAEGPTTGSGFLLSESGLVVTNFHVVEGRSRAKVVLPAIGFDGVATVALQDVHNDIAILRLADFNYGEHYNDAIPYGLGQSVAPADLRPRRPT